MRSITEKTNHGIKRTLIGALFCLALTIPVATAATVVMPTPAQEQEFQTSDDNGRARILISLARGGYHELAANLLKRYPLSGEYGANRTLFVEGLIEARRGNLTGAAAKYRAALANDPSLTLVRSELAQTLAMLDENDSAKHHLQLLMAETQDPAQAAGIRSFMDQLDARRPLTFNAYVSAAPSTNINDGSGLDKVYLQDGEIKIDDSSRAKSGIGMSAGGSVGYSKRLSNDFAIAAGAGVGGRIYKDSSFNSYGASQSVEIRRILDGGYAGVGVVASENFKTDELGFSYISFGPRLTLQKQLTPRDRVSASAVYEWRRYTGNEAADGHALLVDSSWTHALSSDANVGLLLGFNRVTQQDLDFNSYYAYSLGLSLYKELPHGITLDLMGEYRYAHFDEENIIYGEKRRDHRILGQATLTKRDINLFGFAPSVEYTYIYNNSNLANWTYDSHTVEFKLTKDF